ncbi:hypothetical protein LNAOJCKE_3189 [Methylorubrum aminovorans]|uniref:Uncharacterized protein n=1 Tax=Methylorubrum aminovorans TaxID=269069 RepID=A0ABQ4UJM4_9HYPH|nr:hypothetical protein LNAOJCKE_3189 [Methylorubrum aminovorans]
MPSNGGPAGSCQSGPVISGASIRIALRSTGGPETTFSRCGAGSVGASAPRTSSEDVRGGGSARHPIGRVRRPALRLANKLPKKRWWKVEPGHHSHLGALPFSRLAPTCSSGNGFSHSLEDGLIVGEERTALELKNAAFGAVLLPPVQKLSFGCWPHERSTGPLHRASKYRAWPDRRIQRKMRSGFDCGLSCADQGKHDFDRIRFAAANAVHQTAEGQSFGMFRELSEDPDAVARRNDDVAGRPDLPRHGAAGLLQDERSGDDEAIGLRRRGMDVCLVSDGYEETALAAEPDEDREWSMKLGFSRNGRDSADRGIEGCLYEQIPMPALRIGHGRGGLERPKARPLRSRRRDTSACGRRCLMRGHR